MLKKRQGRTSMERLFITFESSVSSKCLLRELMQQIKDNTGSLDDLFFPPTRDGYLFRRVTKGKNL